MIGVLARVVAWLAAAVVLLVALNIGLRIVARRREGQERRLRPRAELSIAEYLAGSGAMPDPTGQGERGVLLRVALDALADLRGSERARLVELLEQRGYVAEAMSGLRARRRALRLRATETLAAAATAAAVPALTAGLASRDALVRTACARTLAEVGGDDVTGAIVATAERDVDVAPGAAAAVVLALGINRPSALAPLLGRDVTPKARAVAIAVVGALRLSEHAAPLQACLADSDELAAAASRGLGLIGEVRSVGALMDLACDEHRAPFARAAAITALGSIGDVSALPLLDSQLRVADWTLRAAAAEALGRLGDPGEAALRVAASSGRPEVRAPAEAALQA
jgi:HEAT repeat protein